MVVLADTGTTTNQLSVAAAKTDAPRNSILRIIVLPPGTLCVCGAAAVDP